MDRQSFLSFTIQGEDLNPAAAKEDIGLPCELFYKDQLVRVTSSGRQIISQSTRWVYSAVSSTGIESEPFLLEHLKIIEKKKSILKDYIKDYNVFLDLVIYETNPENETIYLDEEIIRRIKNIGAKFCVSFKDLERIYSISKFCIQ